MDGGGPIPANPPRPVVVTRDPDADLVKQRLRRSRNRRGWSQRVAAHTAGVSKSVLEKYESREDPRIPNTRQLYRLAEAYGVSIDYLLGRTGDEHAHHSTKR